jgi:hypothetical protein
MRHSFRYVRSTGAGLLAALLASTALMPMASAADSIVFDTDTGTFTVNGVTASSIGGVSVTSAGANVFGDGAQQFVVHGDLTLNGGLFIAGDSLTAVGSRPLDLVVGNNVNIGLNATISVSASGANAGAGGGGGGGAGGQQYTQGGQGGSPFSAATGGTAGKASASCQDPANACGTTSHFAQDGGTGLVGGPNIHGNPGITAPTGSAGAAGFNTAGGGGAGGLSGVGGAANGFGPQAIGGAGGSHGADGGFPFPGANGGVGAPGQSGLLPGTGGNNGTNGTAGGGGTNVGVASTMISGGSGGGAGRAEAAAEVAAARRVPGAEAAAEVVVVARKHLLARTSSAELVEPGGTVDLAGWVASVVRAVQVERVAVVVVRSKSTRRDAFSRRAKFCPRAVKVAVARRGSAAQTGRLAQRAWLECPEIRPSKVAGRATVATAGPAAMVRQAARAVMAVAAMPAAAGRVAR